MLLEISNYSNKKQLTEYLTIEKMSDKFEPSNLNLIKEFDMDENGHVINIIDIKKIQFIASCKTKLEIEIQVAFYINNEGYLEGHILSDLPGNYSSENGYLVDYKSYCDLCKLTNEDILPLVEYFDKIKNGHIGINTIAKFQEKFYNATEQKKMWEIVENNSNSVMS